eukprot:1186838-Prorocentrum_minimum.AAC.1
MNAASSARSVLSRAAACATSAPERQRHVSGTSSRRDAFVGAALGPDVSARSLGAANIPMLPASDWSIRGIYPCLLRLIGPWETSATSPPRGSVHERV